ncbi:MAG: thioredoxin domain-containing protein [Patescibacteria group bacterium]
MIKSNIKQIFSVVIIIVFVIVLAFLLKGSKPPVREAVLPFNNTENTGLFSEDHLVGNPEASIVIIEYSDTECPFCKIFHATMQRVVENSNGNVAWVYRHYPIPALHEKAFHEAEATECAWEQGGNVAFWKYINRMFEITPSNDGLEVTELSTIAKYIGLDVKLFESCLASGKFESKVQAQIDQGIADGAEGTPYSLILKDGKVVDTINGAEKYENIIQTINKLK